MSFPEKYCQKIFAQKAGLGVLAFNNIYPFWSPMTPKIMFLAHLWGAYAIPVALSGVRRLCPPYLPDITRKRFSEKNQ